VRVPRRGAPCARRRHGARGRRQGRAGAPGCLQRVPARACPARPRNGKRAVQARRERRPAAGAGCAAGWLERLLSLAHGSRVPGGGASAERAGLVLGGGAGAKVAVAAGVGVLAVAGAGVSAIHSLQGSTPITHRRVVPHPLARTAVPAVTSIAPTSEPGALPTAQAASPKPAPSTGRTTDRPQRSRPPSRDLGYLAIGGPPATTTTTAATGRAASAATSSESGQGEGQSSTPPTPTGGGSSLNYLGR
jgi:hypothetical protein